MENFESELPYTHLYNKDDFDLIQYFELEKVLSIIIEQEKKEVILQFPVFQLSEAIKV